ncbi:peptidylprolyl isomerase fpr3 [Entomophthora muscae]|uniref:Peptidylprolyl isomerase fpr3 n=2 Tax=Entomophthora muscae TaxID=34485 RepID=A0ACC2U2L6_9FUNG|nr:peptidylprolyl isomerase fpr3 [Entomophthora muscae]
MDADFWGLLILPGKKYSNEAHQPIRLTTACFGEKVVKGSRSCVYLTIEEREFVLCVLSESLNESQSLDVYLPTEAEFSFRVSGPNEVHLTGHIVTPPEDSELESDDELMKAYARGEFGSDSDSSYEGEDSEDSDSDSLEPADITEIIEPSKLKKDNIKAPKEKKQESKPAVSAIDAKPTTQKKEKKQETKSAATPSDAQAISSKKDKKHEAKALTSQPSEGQNGLSKKEKKKLAKQATEVCAQKDEAPKRKAEDSTSVSKKTKSDATKPVQKAPESKPAPPQNGAKTFSNGLVVDDKVVGEGKVAKKGSSVQMRYIGKLKNGKVFDQNSNGKPFTFRLGAGEVIRGWDLGIEGMKVGGERRLTIPPQLGYGKSGAAPEIPGNATLVFDVKLLGVK